MDLVIVFLFVSLLVMMYVNYEKDKKNKTLATQLTQFKDQIPSQDKTSPLDGLFEIHITIEQDFTKMLHFIKTKEHHHSFKPVFAVSSVSNNQYMISHFTRKTDENKAIEFALNLSQEFVTSGMKVLRVKVESHGAKGTPLSTRDYEMFCEYSRQRYGPKAGKPYFEFHVKISRHKQVVAYYEMLEKQVKEFGNGVAISYNLCSKNLHPLLTIRCYDQGFTMAESFKDKVINHLKQQGYVFEDQIQQEFSVYDTNAELDKGWL